MRPDLGGRERTGPSDLAMLSPNHAQRETANEGSAPVV